MGKTSAMLFAKMIVFWISLAWVAVSGRTDCKFKKLDGACFMKLWICMVFGRSMDVFIMNRRVDEHHIF